MEIVVELVLELLGSFVSVLVGLVLGTVALVAMVVVRRAQAHVARSSEVSAPDGEVWSVRVVFGIGRKVSERFAGMSRAARRERRLEGHADAAVGRNEIWHPKRLLDAYDEAAGLVAPFVVVAAVLIGVVFVIELVIALPVGIVFVLASSVRGRWQVEVVDPEGVRTIVDTPSLRDARETAERTAQRIAGGVAP